jgi:hypothetical protein
LGRGTEKASQARCWLLVQAFEVLRTGENGLSQGVSASCYGSEVGDVKLPRKALYPLRHHGLYPKPTQVGW